MRELRRWLIEDREFASVHLYTGGYWHPGHDEDSYQQIKRSMPMD